MFNKIIIVGNLTRDVELRYLNTGSAVATLGLASNRRYKKQDGTPVDDTCFVDVTLFGRSAEVANQYLRKGSKVLIEGRLHYETWQDQQGMRRSKHTVIAESMQMLDSKQSQGFSPQGEYAQDYSNTPNGSYGANSYTNNMGYTSPNYNQSHGRNFNDMESNSQPNPSVSISKEYSNLTTSKNLPNHQNIPEINVDSDEEIPF